MDEKNGSARTKRQAESRKMATAQSDAVFTAMDKRAAENFFANRGFSDQTVKALVDHGIKLPEELLVMPESDVSRIVGLGREGITEVQLYRKRFPSICR